MEVSNMDSHAVLIEPEFHFIAGNLCLDFANTLGGLPPDSISQDRLTSYARLVAWSQQANLMSESEAHSLLSQADRAQSEAAAVLERAHALRQAIYGIFTALDLGTQLTRSDLNGLNSELDRGMAGARVIITEDGFGLGWRNQGDLDDVLRYIASSAAALLTSGERQLVHQCANEQCPWLFLDTTKNHRRRWCRTSGCGNMMRVRKHRERQHSQE
jgi:predicted RNA-binding Zn ribbon-like protein